MLVLLVFAAPAGAHGDGFVRAHRDALRLDGGPFYFVGANLAVLHGAERAQYVETLVHARNDGVMVGRIWALGEGDGTESAERKAYLFRNGPHDWNEAAFAHLDHVVAAARLSGLRLVVVLANSWADYGGIPMYLKWAGLATRTDPAFSDAFYTNGQAIAWYREHVRRVVSRVSSVTGTAYRDDPTILGWELVNESHVTPEGAPSRRRWIAEMTSLVHQLDPNHLVTIGHAGYRTLRERNDWVLDHQLPGVDYADHHLYAQPDIAIRHPSEVAPYVEERVRLAREVVGKPIVFGEVGFEAAQAGALQETRASLFARVFEAARAAGAAGILSWIYLPPGIARRGHPISWGPESADSVEVRRAIFQAARRAWLGPDAPLARRDLVFEPRFQLAARPGAVSLDALSAGRNRREVVLRVAASQASASRWERQGYAAQVSPAHAWGSDVGYFEYAFALTRGRPRKIVVRATVSGERPGNTAPLGATSPFTVWVAGIAIGQGVAVRDDGRGARVRFESSDPAVMGRLAGGTARVRFAVGEGDGANGLCVYEPGVEIAVHY